MLSLRRLVPQPSLWMALTTLGVVLTATAATRAQELRLDAELDHHMLRADEHQTFYLHLAVTGFQAPPQAPRPPLNVAFVVDKSASMRGEPLAATQRALTAAVEALGPDDVVSVIAFDGTVEVVVPATRVTDRAAILTSLQHLEAGGACALFAGVVKGAREARKFLTPDRINRVIIVSGGNADVGPATPPELARLAKTLRRDGLGLITLGVGLDYREELLATLARESGGRYYFVERPSALPTLVRTGLMSLQALTAQDVSVTIRFYDGFRPTAILRRSDVEPVADFSDLSGQNVTFEFPPLAADETREVVLEAEATELPPQKVLIAAIDVSFRDLTTRQMERVSRELSAEVTPDPTRWAASEVPEVVIATVERLAYADSRRAFDLLERGEAEQARLIFDNNVKRLRETTARYRAPRLSALADANEGVGAKTAVPEAWRRERKRLLERAMGGVEQPGSIRF